MKVLALLFFSLTLPGTQFAPPMRQPVETSTHERARRGGTWYFAESGHAVYCYGPVIYMTDAQGGLQRVATFCKGKELIVPVKD